MNTHYTVNSQGDVVQPFYTRRGLDYVLAANGPNGCTEIARGKVITLVLGVHPTRDEVLVLCHGPRMYVQPAVKLYKMYDGDPVIGDVEVHEVSTIAPDALNQLLYAPGIAEKWLNAKRRREAQ